MNLSSDGHEAKVPVIRRPEYTVSLEQINPETAFAHVDIHVPWTASVRRRFSEDLDRFYEIHGGPLYTGIRPDDLKLQRFTRLMGGEHVAYHTDLSTGHTLLIFKR